MSWPVQRRALRRRSLPARPARRLRAQRRPMWSASQRCCFKHRALRTLLGRKFLRTRTASAGAARPFSWLATIESYCLLTFHRAPLAAAPQTAATALISACETAHVPAALLPRLSLRTKCVAVAIAGTWQLGRSPWQWLSRGRFAQHTHPAATTARRQMQPGVAQKLLTAVAFPHDVPPITVRAVRVRLLRELERAGGESLFVLPYCCAARRH